MQPLPAFLISYSDSDFTNPHQVVLHQEPQDCRGDFTHMGAKYWGLESRRHRATAFLAHDAGFAYDHNAHNWFSIGLQKRATISKISISTKWYTGNQVRAVSVILKDERSGIEKRVLTRAKLDPDAEHVFEITPTLATEALVECYYEGGIARVVFFGNEAPDQASPRPNLLESARITHVSNEHYGKPDKAVFGNRAEMHMVGWESARTGFGERALFHLQHPARIDEIVVDTYLHRLNAPLSCHVFGLQTQDAEKEMTQAPRWKIILEGGREIIPDDFQSYMLEQKYLDLGPTRFEIRLHLPKDSPWQPVLPFAPLSPDTYHRFRKLENAGPFTHILYMHYPNGGIHGLKVFGV